MRGNREINGANREKGRSISVTTCNISDGSISSSDSLQGMGLDYAGVLPGLEIC